MIKLAVFDFDSTLMDGESVDFLARDFGVEDEIMDVTKKAMAGELDFFEALKHRVSLLRGMKYQRVKEVFSFLPLMKGAQELLTFLKKRESRILCLSGGFVLGVEILKNKNNLPLDACFANILHHKDEVLTGEVGGSMMFLNSKGLILKEIQNLLQVKREETLCVGDGFNDISMFKEAGVSVAFCANQRVKQHASHIVDNKDLSEIIKILESKH